MAKRPLPDNDERVPDGLRTVFGRNLRAARLAAGMTQQTLATAANLDRSYIVGAEQGKWNVSIEAGDAMARAVGKTLTDLLAQRPNS